MFNNTAISAKRTKHILFFGCDRLSAYRMRICDVMRRCSYYEESRYMREHYKRIRDYIKMIIVMRRLKCGIPRGLRVCLMMME